MSSRNQHQLEESLDEREFPSSGLVYKQLFCLLEDIYKGKKANKGKILKFFLVCVVLCGLYVGNGYLVTRTDSVQCFNFRVKGEMEKGKNDSSIREKTKSPPPAATDSSSATSAAQKSSTTKRFSNSRGLAFRRGVLLPKLKREDAFYVKRNDESGKEPSPPPPPTPFGPKPDFRQFLAEETNSTEPTVSK